MTISIEKVENNEISFKEALDLGLELLREGGMAPFDAETFTNDAYAILTHDASFIARDDDTDEPVGLIAMVEEPFNYSTMVHLRSKHLYVKPEYRSANALTPGPVLMGLLRAAKEEAEKRGLIVLVTVDNPDRNARRRHISIEAQVVGFVPQAYVFKLR